MKLYSKSYKGKYIFLIICILLILTLYFSSQHFHFTTLLFSVSYDEQLPPVNCSAFGFGNQTSNEILIYDFFIFNNELDMLEIRLYELYNYVDLFLIAESNLTLSGKPKPFYLKDNWSQFSRYHKKMRRVEVPLSNLINTTKRSWDNERQMRDEGLRLALPNSTRDFLLFESDIDEITKSRFIRALRFCKLPQPFPSMLLQCDFYYYSFEYLQPSSSKWPGGSLSHYSPNQTVPSGLRFAKAGFKPMRGTCFHCSYCFDSIASVRLKLSSFSHTEFNTDRYRSLEHIIDRYRNGKDFFDNIHKPFERSKMNETELPRLFKIPEQRERFMYMFNRSSMANVGFRDFNMTIGL